MNSFQKTQLLLCLLFFGALTFVVIKAYSRTSGATGHDMAKVQKMRAVFMAEEK